MAPKKIAPKVVATPAKVVATPAKKSAAKVPATPLAVWTKVQTAEGWKRGMKKARMGK